MKTLLITGTDTNVGKTFITTALVAYHLHYHPQSSLGLMKLIQTGTGDRELYQQLFTPYPKVELVTPLVFAAPVAPPIAAQQQGEIIDLAKIWQSLNHLRHHHDLVLVEAIGGLGTPVTDEFTVADLAKEWRLPTILVVPVRLGAISAAVANVGYARLLQIPLVGIILNCVSEESAPNLHNWAPKELIESLTRVPILGVFPYRPELTDLEFLAEVVSKWHWELNYG